MSDEIDLRNPEGLARACWLLADEDMARIEPGTAENVLKALFANLRFWHVQNARALARAHAFGHAGIGLQTATEAHDYIGAILHEEPFKAPEPRIETPELIVPSDD